MTVARNSIPVPASDRTPLKVNVYEFARHSATTLAPLFPYVDAGSIVPCLSVFHGGPGRRYGRFQHFNSVDEVISLFTDPARLVSVGSKLHLVGAPFDDPEDPENMALAVITQRQNFDATYRGVGLGRLRQSVPGCREREDRNGVDVEANARQSS
jgi:hypothetical protein